MAGSSRSGSKTSFKPNANPVRMAPVALRRRQASIFAGKAVLWASSSSTSPPYPRKIRSPWSVEVTTLRNWPIGTGRCGTSWSGLPPPSPGCGMVWKNTAVTHSHLDVPPADPEVQEVADGVFAYLQLDGQWGLNNTAFLAG